MIPAVGDGPFPDDSWLSPLYKAIYPSRADWRRSAPDERCPKFGESSVLSRPSDYDREEEMSVRPGIVRPEHGDHEVVWWDPSKLTLNIKGRLTLDHETMLADDGGASFRKYLDWEQQRSATLAQGSEPEFRVITASQSEDAPPSPIAVAVEHASGAAGRTGGRRFGTLVHAAMRDIDLDATPASIAGIVEMNARKLGAPPEEAQAAKDAVAAAIGHPLLVRARQAARCHREYPVTLKLPDRRLVEGIIDLAFVENGQWIIVDFKTDADLEQRRESYERQLQWYAYALLQLTGMASRAYLLGV